MHATTLSLTPGLLWGFAFRDGRASRLTNETAAEILAAPHDWSWMHFALSDHRARRFLDTFAAAPAEARALLLSSETRLQIRLGDGHAYGILPDVEKDFEGQSLGAGRLAFFLDGARLVTVRHRPLRAVDAVREQLEDGALTLAAPCDGFTAIVARFIAMVDDRLLLLGQQLDHIEDVVLSDRDDIDPSGLGPLRRELSRYHREFVGLRGALARAVAGRGPGAAAGAAQAHAEACPIAPHLPALAQAAEDFDRDAAALADRARLLYEEMDTRIAAITNRSLRTLTILSTLLLPPTFIAGAFGMNLVDIPWGNSPGGFWWALGLCAVVVGGSYVLLRRFRIL